MKLISFVFLDLLILISSRERSSLGQVISPEFPKWGRLVGVQFGQSGQKVHENDKIGIFGSKQWWGHGGTSQFFG